MRIENPYCCIISCYYPELHRALPQHSPKVFHLMQPHIFLVPDRVPGKRPPMSVQPTQEPGMAISLPKRQTPMAIIGKMGFPKRIETSSIIHATAWSSTPTPQRTQRTSPKRRTKHGVSEPADTQPTPARRTVETTYFPESRKPPPLSCRSDDCSCQSGLPGGGFFGSSEKWIGGFAKKRT